MDYLLSLSKPGTKDQVIDQCVKLDENIIDQIVDKLNYKVLVKLVDISTPLNAKYAEYLPVGHHYAILVYLTGDMRKFYYQGLIKLEQLFMDSQNLSYVVLHLQTDGIRGKYFNNYNDLANYYEDLHSKRLQQFLHTFTVYEGSGAENKDNTRLRVSLKDVLEKKYSLSGNIFKLFLDKWNCIDFVNYLKSRLAR